MTSTEGQAGGDADVNEELEEILRVGRENEAHLRRALDFALEVQAAPLACTAILGALGALMKAPIDAAALEMAQTAVSALVTKNPVDRKHARCWHARRDGFDPAQQGIAIFDLAREVARTAYFFRQSGTLFATGVDAIQEFRAGYLEGLFGGRVPGTTELADMFARLDQPNAKGGLTVAGIVTRILHAGRHLGASSDARRTLMRVDRLLSRANKRQASAPKAAKRKCRE